MNYIKVDARDWRIGRPMIDRDTEWKEIVHFSEGDEETFDFKKSVFRNFKLDTPQMVEKMFEGDMALTKI